MIAVPLVVPLFVSMCAPGAPLDAPAAAKVVCAPGSRVEAEPRGARLIGAHETLTVPFAIDGPLGVFSKSTPQAPLSEIATLVRERIADLRWCVAGAVDRHVDLSHMAITLEADAFATAHATVAPDDRALQACISAAFVDVGPTLVPGHPFRVEIPVAVVVPTSGKRAHVDPVPRRTAAPKADVCVAADAPVTAGQAEPLEIDLREGQVWMMQGRPILLCSETLDISALVSDIDAWDRCLKPAPGVHGTVHVALVIDAGGTVRGVPKLLSQALEGGEAEARGALPACVLRTLSAQRIPPRVGGRALEVKDLELKLP